MVQTTVRPKNSDFDMAVSLPNNYVGKEVHVLFYIDEEVKTTQASVLSTKNLPIFLVYLLKKKEKSLNNTLSKFVTNGAEIFN